MSCKNIVIVGGGISGLLAALVASEENPDARIRLLERAPEVGGLLRAFDYGEYGRFDYGMHNLLETGDKELDQLVFSLLPECEWYFLEGNKRDLAGVYFNGRLQHNSPYVDLLSFPAGELEKHLASFFQNLNQNPQADTRSAGDFVRSRFGEVIGNEIFSPIISKLYGHKADAMAYMATLITPLSRICLFETDIVGDLTRSELLRERIAFTEQRELPLERSSGKRGFYPRKYGIWRLVDAMQKRLQNNGVEILTQASVSKVIHQDGLIRSLEVQIAGKQDYIGDIDTIVWSIGLPQLASMLGLIDSLPSRFDRPKQTVIVNLILDRLPDMGDLYYFYCYDKPYKTFRVTNYSAYCPEARRKDGYPVCVEMLVDNDSAGDPEKLAVEAVAELDAFGVLASGTKLLFKRAECLESGFPMPTKNNISGMNSMREAVRDLRLKNLITTGILSEENLFFQGDVLQDTFRKVKVLSEKCE